MPIVNSRMTKTYLDDKQCFDLWIELGTLEKVRQHLYSLGIKNPLSGNMATPFGIRTAAFRWMLHNLDEAWEIMAGKYHILGRDEFDQWAVYKAMSFFQGENAFRKWLISRGWYDNKRYLSSYERKYPKLHARGG